MYMDYNISILQNYSLTCLCLLVVMALHAKNLSLLLLLVFFTLLQTEARESKLFTKAVHYHINKPNVPQVDTAPTPAPAPSQSLAPTPAPTPTPELPAILTPELAPASIEAEFGYGLYSQGSSEYSPETVSNQNDVPAKEFTTESYMNAEENVNPTGPEFTTDQSYMKADENAIPSGELTTDQSYMKADENAVPGENVMLTGELTTDQSYMKANENAIPSGDQFTTESYMKADESSYKNGYSGNNNEKNGYGDSNSNGYVTGRQGLSDTRFLENGKYYYYVNNENYFQTGNAPVRGNGNSIDEGYYGNNDGSKYEFDTMEEYERQEEYPQIQREEYNP